MPTNKVRRNGSYAPLSAHYYKDDAIIAAGERAEVLYTRGLAFCADVLSDGFVSDRQVVHIGVGLPGLKQRTAALIREGLWERDDQRGGYVVRQWLKWNRSRDEIDQAADKDADRKQPKTRAPWRDRQRNPNGNQDDNESESERSPNGRTPGGNRPGEPANEAKPDAHTGRKRGNETTLPAGRTESLPSDRVPAASGMKEPTPLGSELTRHNATVSERNPSDIQPRARTPLQLHSNSTPRSDRTPAGPVRSDRSGDTPALTPGRSASPDEPPMRRAAQPPDLTDLRKQLRGTAARYRNADRRPPALPSTPAATPPGQEHP